MKEPMHPSGLTMRAWNWPFKTPEQRKKVATWFKKQEREKKLNQPEALL
jgi:(p)ppGpp synthase/HD superfamily hydrolase